MIKVLIPGSFDLFHIGHLNVLKNARACGDYLVVAIHCDSDNLKQTEYFYTPEERMKMIKDLRFVDEVVFYERIDILVENVEFDILCHGPDNKHEYCLKAYKWCRDKNRGIRELPRTEEISSTKIRNYLNTHGV